MSQMAASAVQTNRFRRGFQGSSAVRPERPWWSAILLGALLFGAVSAAQASVVTISGVLQGVRGAQLSVTVQESELSDFEAADLALSFDPAVLRFAGLDFAWGLGLAGLVTPANGAASVPLSLAANSPLSGSDIALFSLRFDILDSAPLGRTTISFESLDASLYDRPFTEVSLQVVEPPPASVPEMGSLALTLTALALLPLGRRRSLAPHAAGT